MAMVTLKAVEYAAYPAASKPANVSVVEFVIVVGANALQLLSGMHVVKEDGSTVVMPVCNINENENEQRFLKL